MKSTAASKIKLGNKYPREAMTTAEKLIELDAKRRSLKSIQNTMQEAHKFPLETVSSWWKEARKLVTEIETQKQALDDIKQALIDMPNAEEPLTGETLLCLHSELHTLGFGLQEITLKCGYRKAKGKADFTGIYEALTAAKGS